MVDGRSALSKVLAIGIVIVVVLGGLGGFYFLGPKTLGPPAPSVTTRCSTTSTISIPITTSSSSNSSTRAIQPPEVTNAENFLVNEYNKSIGLLPESISNGSDAPDFWLYSDNYLVIQAFRNGTTSNPTQEELIAQNVSRTLRNYMSEIPKAENQYMVLTQPVFYFNDSKDYHGYFTAEGKNISITLNNHPGTLNPDNFGDIAFLEAISYHDIGNSTKAVQLFQIGASMYDGIGIKDSVWQGQGHQYQTFKLALYIYVGKLLGQSVPSSAYTNLLRMQGTDGGFYSGYSSSFSTGTTLENTETTSLAILALC